MINDPQLRRPPTSTQEIYEIKDSWFWNQRHEILIVLAGTVVAVVGYFVVDSVERDHHRRHMTIEPESSRFRMKLISLTRSFRQSCESSDQSIELDWAEIDSAFEITFQLSTYSSSDDSGLGNFREGLRILSRYNFQPVDSDFRNLGNTSEYYRLIDWLDKNEIAIDGSVAVDSQTLVLRVCERLELLVFREFDVEKFTPDRKRSARSYR